MSQLSARPKPEAAFVEPHPTGFHMPRCRKGSGAGNSRCGISKSERAFEAATLGLKPFRRLITICAWCKKIRNHNGGWCQTVAVEPDAETQFTHGICPTCAENEYHAYQAGKNAVNDAPAVQYMSNDRQTGAQQLSAISRG